jgi:hypothetical protein
MPDDYRRLHRVFIPYRDRIQFWFYCGYYLCIRLSDIEGKCELLAA